MSRQHHSAQHGEGPAEAAVPRHGGEAEGVDVSRRARSSHVGHDKHSGHSVEMFRN